MTASNPLPSPEGDQRIPSEAREGPMRAWLAILRERHPNVTWVAVEPPPQGDRRDVGSALRRGTKRPAQGPISGHPGHTE